MINPGYICECMFVSLLCQITIKFKYDDWPWGDMVQTSRILIYQLVGVI